LTCRGQQNALGYWCSCSPSLYGSWAGLYVAGSIEEHKYVPSTEPQTAVRRRWYKTFSRL